LKSLWREIGDFAEVFVFNGLTSILFRNLFDSSNVFTRALLSCWGKAGKDRVGRSAAIEN